MNSIEENHRVDFRFGGIIELIQIFLYKLDKVQIMQYRRTILTDVCIGNNIHSNKCSYVLIDSVIIPNYTTKSPVKIFPFQEALPFCSPRLRY